VKPHQAERAFELGKELSDPDDGLVDRDAMGRDMTQPGADFFISYTQSDRTWAEWVAWQLEVNGYRIIVQAWDFTPGSDWVHKMQLATSSAKRTIAILSPDYLQSVHGEAEWRVAYAHDPTGEEGRLILVRVLPCHPPGLLTTRVILDLVGLTEQVAAERLIDGLKARRARPTRPPSFPGTAAGLVSAGMGTGQPGFRLGRLHGVPSRPAKFIRRVEISAEVKAALLTRSGPMPPLCLVGMGGVGKSIIASDVVRDELVQRHFPEGIYWVPVGRGADICIAQARLIRALGGTVTGREDEEVGIGLIGDLLTDRSCLVVLDDVWRSSDVDAFQSVGELSRLLITTRNAQIAANASEIQVDTVGDREALELLAVWSDQDVGRLPPEAAEVARRCGNLPLALSLAGASARGGGSRWRGLLRRLEEIGPRALAPRADANKLPELLASLEVSVNDLNPEDRELYSELVVFGKQDWIPEGIVCTLWSYKLDPSLGLELVDTLVERSLVQRDQETGSIRVHDLLADSLAEWASPEKVQSLHLRLATTILGNWGDGARGLQRNLMERAAQEDPAAFRYAVRSIFMHLLKAHKLQFVVTMLQAEWQRAPIISTVFRQENAWYSIHDAIGEPFAYLNDIRRLDKRIRELEARTTSDLQDDVSLTAAAFQCALLTSSTLSSFALVPSESINELVLSGAWAPERALGHAQRIPDPGERIVALQALIPELPAGERSLAENAVNAVTAAWSQLDRHRIHAEIAPHLPDALMQRALLASNSKNWDRDLELRLSQFFTFQSIYNNALLQERLVDALVGLAASSSVETERSELIEHALITARMIPPLSMQIEGDERPSINTTMGTGSRVRALLAIVPQLPDEDQTSVVEEAAQFVLDNGDFDYAHGAGIDARRELIENLTGRLRVVILDKTLEDAQAIAEPQSKAYALGKLLPFLPRDRAERTGITALELAQSLNHAGRRAATLARLARDLPDYLFERATSLAMEISEPESRSEVLLELMGRVGKLERQALIAQVLRDIRSSDAWHRARLTVGILPFVPDAVKLDLLNRALDIDSLSAVGSRASTISVLAPVMPATLIPKALEKAAGIETPEYRVQALGALSHRLADPATLTQTPGLIGDDHETAMALLSLVPYIEDPEKCRQIVDFGLSCLRSCEESHWRRVFEEIVPRMPVAYLPLLLEFSSLASNKHTRISLLLTLADRQENVQREQILQMAEDLIVDDSDDDILSISWLKDLLKRKKADDRERLAEHILQRIESIDHNSPNIFLGPDIARAHSLYELSAYLPASQIDLAFRLVRTIRDANWRLRLLTEIAPHLTGSALQSVLENEASVDPSPLSFDAERYSMFLLVTLADRFPSAMLEKVLEIIRPRRSSLRAYGLIRVSTRLPEPRRSALQQEAIASLKTADPSGAAKYVLTWIARDILPHLRPELIEFARSLPKKGDGAAALLAIAYTYDEPERNELVREAFYCIESVTAGIERILFLQQLLPVIDRQDLPSLLRYAIINGDRILLHPPASYDELISSLSRSAALTAWRAALDVLITRTRKDLLSNMRLLRPILVHLGGPEAAGRTADLIVLAKTGWP
jgi:TIR domain/NB-ARC domain